jgi:hypothetical protein
MPLRGNEGLHYYGRDADSMKYSFSRLRILVSFALVATCSLLLIGAGAVAWEFDYFGWHSKARWLVHADKYKAKVLSEPVGTNGLLRHVEWDGWGFAGNDTTVYLVFDPTDALSTAARTAVPGKYAGLPCEVARVERMDQHWYKVLFYTETDWDHCA